MEHAVGLEHDAKALHHRLEEYRCAPLAPCHPPPCPPASTPHPHPHPASPHPAS